MWIFIILLVWFLDDASKKRLVNKGKSAYKQAKESYYE